jgi:hypothetical protein
LSENIILIDLENVQPKNLELLASHPFKVLVFVGANQGKISFDLASAMQSLGTDSRYIKISGNGPNALDFHIAYYIGELSQQFPKSKFHIISKDTGFDPLIRHLRSRKIRVQREKDLAEIPALQISDSTTNEEKVEAIVKNLVGRGQSRPRKVKTLANTINTLFTKKLDESELMLLIEVLKKRKFVLIKDGNVSYKLPDSL